jgi:hypothetical protein
MKLREQVDQAQKDLALLTAALDASKTATTEDQRNAVLALLAQFVAVKSDIPLLIESQNDARDLIAVMSRSAEVSSAADVSGSVVVPPPPSAEEIYKQANDVLDKATTTQELDYLIARCQSLLKQSNLDRSLRIQTQDLLERAIASRKVLEKYSGREQ